MIFPDDSILADVLSRHPEFTRQGGMIGKIVSGVFRPLTGPETANFLGYHRVSRVIVQIGVGEVVEVGRLIATTRGNTDIDIVFTRDRYIAVGGRKKNKKLNEELKKLLEYARIRNGNVYFYYDAVQTSQVALNTARQLLGDAQVIAIL